MIEIKSGGKEVKYIYNDKNQLMMQIVDGCPIYFEYTKYGQLKSKILGGKVSPVSMLKYIYSPDGTIIGRVLDDKYQMYLYDRRGQLLQVSDMQGNVAERYVYDPAGNILSKTVNGKTTSYAYDKANQLVSSTCNGKTTHYEYDAAGRMVKEGDKSYTYGYLDKILAVQLDGQQTAAFDYHMDGQLARVVRGDKSEEFSWDGLALIHRGGTNYINEPYVTGGNPILSSKDGVMFNDMLGSTLNIGGKAVNMTAFGESADTSAMYTGKPCIGELGYAFLFRNYRADQGKWQTTDPLGYPDGWNNLAYGNNEATIAVDRYGLSVWQWTCETLAALSYGVLYIFNGTASGIPGGAVVKWYFGPGTIPAGIASLYTVAVVQNMDSVTRNIDSYYNSVIAPFSNNSTVGTYNLSSAHYYVSNNKNTVWGAIVGTSSLIISGRATVTQSSDGGRDVAINLTCQFYDDIDWKSYEELVVDHNGSFANWGATSYIEGALDVWLDKGLKANYEIDVSWTKSFYKHFAE